MAHLVLYEIIPIQIKDNENSKDEIKENDEEKNEKDNEKDKELASGFVSTVVAKLP